MKHRTDQLALLRLFLMIKTLKMFGFVHRTSNERHKKIYSRFLIDKFHLYQYRFYNIFRYNNDVVIFKPNSKAIKSETQLKS